MKEWCGVTVKDGKACINRAWEGYRAREQEGYRDRGRKEVNGKENAARDTQNGKRYCDRVNDDNCNGTIFDTSQLYDIFPQLTA